MVIILGVGSTTRAQISIGLGGLTGGFSGGAKVEIPKPKKKGKPATFESAWGKKMELGIWNPASFTESTPTQVLSQAAMAHQKVR